MFMVHFLITMRISIQKYFIIYDNWYTYMQKNCLRSFVKQNIKNVFKIDVL